MDRNFLIQLTNNLYRLTLFFPKKEPLRYKMRDLATDILAKPNEKDLDVLHSYFEVALSQNWVSPSDILAIKEEYDNLKGELKEVKEEKKSVSVALEIKPQTVPVLNNHNPDRKERILDFLKQNGKVQVWQVKQLMPDVSKRTLRRDFEYMLEQGLVERIGERNDTFYKMKTLQA